MTKTNDSPKPPNKPTMRGRRKRVRFEDNPSVKAWCDDFVKATESAHGFTPTQEQAMQAFLVAALKAIGKE